MRRTRWPRYYGRFPARAHAAPRGAGVGPRRERRAVVGASRAPSVRIIIGERATAADLARDWVLVHELTHLAFPSVPSRHHWIEEGLASYVEPVARAQAGQLDPREAVWAELAAGLPKGLPQPGDRGLDHTPTWGRTYWGGALFALLADVEIQRRRRTGRPPGRAARDPRRGQYGDVLAARAVARDRRPGDRRARARRALRADEGSAGARRPRRAVARAGRRIEGRTARLDDGAPLAAARRAITAPPPAPAAERPPGLPRLIIQEAPMTSPRWSLEGKRGDVDGSSGSPSSWSGSSSVISSSRRGGPRSKTSTRWPSGSPDGASRFPPSTLRSPGTRS